jgi:hypothetical protein
MWVSGSGVQDVKLEQTVLQCYPNSEFFYEIPTAGEVEKMVQAYDFWVYDDLATELKKNSSFTNFFTKICHHKNCIMAYLCQNPYEQGPDSATRARNCGYQIFFCNKADVRWIESLGRQMLGRGTTFGKIFQEATQKPYDCLLCDNRITTPSKEQFIANAFNDEQTYFLVPHK